MVIIQLIAATTTVTGLNVACELDTNTYQKGIKVTAEELASINISYDQLHPTGTTPSLPSDPPDDDVIPGRALSAAASSPSAMACPARPSASGASAVRQTA
jgi:hypothetical protein